MHKTWEGDATGTVTKPLNDYMMSIKSNGLHLATKNLGPDLSSLVEGNILTCGTIEVEVGELQSTPSAHPRQPSQSWQSTTVKRIKLTPQEPLKPPLKPDSHQVPLKTSPLSASDAHVRLNRKAKTDEDPDVPVKSDTFREGISVDKGTKMETAKPVTLKAEDTQNLAHPRKPKDTMLKTDAFRNAAMPFISPFKSPIPGTDSVSTQFKSATFSSACSRSMGSTPLCSESAVNRIPLDSPAAVCASEKGFVKPWDQNSTSVNETRIFSPLMADLRPHQVEAVQFMKATVLGRRHRYGNGCILADDMGLGKTLSAIALIQNLLAEKHIQNALIACPVTLISNWRQEFKKWQKSSVNIGVLSIDKNGLGNGSLKDPAMAFFNDPKFRSHQVLLVGYERVRGFSSQLTQAGRQFDLVICDEGHRLKTAGSLTAEALANVSGDKRIILTGTPIQNDLKEFWALAEFVNPGCLDSETKFTRKFAAPIDFLIAKQQGNEAANDDMSSSQVHEEAVALESRAIATEKAEDALAELTEICDEIMLRRTADVIKKYVSVPRSEYVVFCRPTKRQLDCYATVAGQAQQLWSDANAFGSSFGFDQQACLQTINELRKIAAGGVGEQGGKLNMLNNLLDVLSTKTDEKIVIVSGSTRVLDICQSMLVSKRLQWLRLDGQTPQEKRQSCVRIFNKTDNGGAFAFLLSSRAGGMGLNLTGGSRLVLLDCDWNPAIDSQAMARIHRDGQTRPCHIYRFLTTGTIEEKIFQRQLSKIGLSQNVLLDTMKGSGVTKADFTKDVLRDLFTLSVPKKCNTLETLGTNGNVKGYREESLYLNQESNKSSQDLDPVLTEAITRAQNVSCVMVCSSPPV